MALFRSGSHQARTRRQEELVEADHSYDEPAGAPRAVPGVPTWEEIVDQHSDRVYRLAFRLTGNRHDAEDLTQEVFVRVFRSLSTYQPGTFEGWIHRITTNLFLDQASR
jgi:RNA polymerase sigma-70 factor (ECF subfamily)